MLIRSIEIFIVSFLFVFILLYSRTFDTSPLKSFEKTSESVHSSFLKFRNSLNPSSLAAITIRQFFQTPIIIPSDHILGYNKAPITIIMYADFDCPYSKEFFTVVNQLMDTYPTKIRFVYRHFPLTFHKTAHIKSKAAECAGQLSGVNGFFRYSSTLYDQQDILAKNSDITSMLQTYARQQNINPADFQICMKSNHISDRIANQVYEAKIEGVTGTPNSFILRKNKNIIFLPGSYSFEYLVHMLALK